MKCTVTKFVYSKGEVFWKDRRRSGPWTEAEEVRRCGSLSVVLKRSIRESCFPIVFQRTREPYHLEHSASFSLLCRWMLMMPELQSFRPFTLTTRHVMHFLLKAPASCDCSGDVYYWFHIYYWSFTGSSRTEMSHCTGLLMLKGTWEFSLPVQHTRGNDVSSSWMCIHSQQR